jgi:hypothetical protein
VVVSFFFNILEFPVFLMIPLLHLFVVLQVFSYLRIASK